MPGWDTSPGRRRSPRSTRTSAASRFIRCRPSTAAAIRRSSTARGRPISGETDEALAVARELAETLGLQPFELADGDRTLYHAGAVFASNYLVTLQRAAVRLGVPAEGLVPLMRGTIDHGFELTGPIARGDWATVESAQAGDPGEHPELEQLYETLAETTAAIA